MAKKKITFDPGQILVFPFQDKTWLKKLTILCLLILLSFIPILPWVLLLGYLAEIIRRIIIFQEAPSLPEWDDLSSYFQEGLRLFGVGAIYLLPPTLLIGIGYLGFFTPILLLESGIMTEGQALGLMIAGYLAGFGLMGIGVLLSMATGLILPVAGTHAVVQGDFTAAFRFKEIWALLKSNWNGFLLAYLILIGAAVVLYYGTYFLAATVILCCLYPFALCFMTAYLGLIGAGLFGEAYRDAQTNLPESIN